MKECKGNLKRSETDLIVLQKVLQKWKNFDESELKSTLYTLVCDKVNKWMAYFKNDLYHVLNTDFSFCLISVLHKSHG